MFRDCSARFWRRATNPSSRFDDRGDQSWNGVLLSFDVDRQSKFAQRGGSHGTDRGGVNAWVSCGPFQSGARAPQSQQSDEILHRGRTGKSDDMRFVCSAGQQCTQALLGRSRCDRLVRFHHVNLCPGFAQLARDNIARDLCSHQQHPLSFHLTPAAQRRPLRRHIPWV